MPDQKRTYPRSAWKRLARTRESKADRSQEYFDHLLKGFGFLSRDGGEHRIYWDADDKANRVSLPRHGVLRAYVAEQVIAAIDRVLERKGLDHG